MEPVPAPGTLHGETTYERLCEEIRSGKLPPGSRLRETEIAERLAVSRTPVREAIRRLEADGLVDHLPRSGAVVRKLNRQFHKLLLDAARNRFLLRAMATVENTLLILGSSSMAKPDRAREAVDEHREVLDALLARDGAAAEAAMRRHMERAQFARLRILRRAKAEDGE